VLGVGEPLMQHCRSDGPVQYPATEVPEHFDVWTHVPEPEGVLHLALVQHFISELPGHRFAVTAPEQQPAEVDTQTPSTPPTEQVALYEHPNKSLFALVPLIASLNRS
jgi:hypothetical protein